MPKTKAKAPTVSLDGAADPGSPVFRYCWLLLPQEKPKPSVYPLGRAGLAMRTDKMLPCPAGGGMERADTRLAIPAGRASNTRERMETGAERCTYLFLLEGSDSGQRVSRRQ